MAITLGFKKSSASKRIEAGHDVIEALISANAELQDAVADLVDNSIDAEATEVEIRLHRLGSTNADGNVKLSISIWDNGKGMTRASLEDAVSLSKATKKTEDRLGKFGVGLKASSFSNSVETTIFTRTKNGSVSGMELSGGPHERVFTAIAETEEGSGFTRSGARVPSSGTIVRWEHLKGISRLSGQQEVKVWLSNTNRTLTRHLGLVFHKFLWSEGNPSGVVLTIREVDQDQGQGITKKISPISPIDKNENGVEKITLKSHYEGHDLDLELLLIPKGQKSEDLESITQSKNGSGFYFYRNSRVIQAGVWNSLLQQGNRDWRLCRVTVELPIQLEKAGEFTVSHDKNSCTFSDGLRDAIISAVDNASGKSLEFFLRKAELRQRERHVVSSTQPKMPLVSGMLEDLLNPLIRDLCHVDGVPVDVSLVDFPQGSRRLFNYDDKHKKLTFNRILRDSPDRNLIFASIVLGLRDYLLRGSLNAQQKTHLDIWNELLWKSHYE